MKKLMLGIALMALGVLGVIALLVSAMLSPLNPWTYNGVSGWWGCLLGMEMTLPFYSFLVLSAVGLGLALWAVFQKK